MVELKPRAGQRHGRWTLTRRAESGGNANVWAAKGDDGTEVGRLRCPSNRVRGGPWRHHRQVINGICWVKRTGSPWRDLPERYGPWKTCYERFRRWAADGTWAAMKQRVLALAEADGDIEWNAQADPTVVRAHQHAAGARKGGLRLRNPGHAKVWAVPGAA